MTKLLAIAGTVAVVVGSAMISMAAFPPSDSTTGIIKQICLVAMWFGTGYATCCFHAAASLKPESRRPQ